jgi:hypothetical protein
VTLSPLEVGAPMPHNSIAMQLGGYDNYDSAFRTLTALRRRPSFQLFPLTHILRWPGCRPLLPEGYRTSPHFGRTTHYAPDEQSRTAAHGPRHSPFRCRLSSVGPFYTAILRRLPRFTAPWRVERRDARPTSNTAPSTLEEGAPPPSRRVCSGQHRAPMVLRIDITSRFNVAHRI